MKKISYSKMTDTIITKRKELQLTQTQLAEKTGIKRAMISRLESQDYIPSIDQLQTKTKTNGVGAKRASRIIFELKDKLKMEDMMDAAYEQSIVQDTQDLNAARDAILALVNLGYSNSEAALAVKKIGDTSQMDIESILKAALKKLI